MVGVDELVARRRDRGQDPEPAVGVLALVRPQHPGGNRGRETPWKPSQPAITIAFELVARPLLKRMRGRSVSRSCKRDVVDLEVERRAALETGCDQVLDDLGLAVDHDRAAAGQVAERDAVALAVELQLDPVVDDAFALACRSPTPASTQEVDRALLEHAGADPVLDVVAAAALEDHGLDPARSSSRPSMSPAGPAPTIPTCVRITAPARSNSAACPCPTPTHSVARP